MNVALYVVDNMALLFFVLALFWPRGRRPGAARLIAAVMCFHLSVMAVVLFAGLVLQSLRVTTVTALCMPFAAAGAVAAWKRGLFAPGALHMPPRRRELARRFTGLGRGTQAMALLVGAVLLYKLLNVFLLREYAYDATSYHLPALVDYLQAGRITLADKTLWSNAYPRNMEMLNLWQLLFFRSGITADLPQFVFTLAGGLAVWGLLREFAISRRTALIGTLIFLSTPVFLAQMSTAYVDTALASTLLMALLFLVRAYRSGGWGDFCLFAVCSAYLAGVKYAAAAYCVILCAAMLVLYALRVKRPGPVLGHAAVLAALVLPLGGFWYFYNLAVFQNPLFPFTLAMPGGLLYHGASMNALLMDNNLPAMLRPLPGALRVAISWLGVGDSSSWSVTAGGVLRSAAVTVTDQRIGGFGFIWPFVLLPCIVWLAVRALRRKKPGAAPLAVAAVLALCFIVTPDNWWSRYTCYVVLFGIYALCVFLERPPRARGASLLLVLLVAAGCVQGCGETFYHDALLVKNTAGIPAEGLRAAALQTQDPAVAALDRLANSDGRPVSIAAFNVNSRFFYLLEGRETQNRLRCYGDYCLRETHSYQDFAALLDRTKSDYVLACGPDAAYLADYARKTRAYRAVSSVQDKQYGRAIVVYTALR